MKTLLEKYENLILSIVGDSIKGNLTTDQKTILWVLSIMFLGLLISLVFLVISIIDSFNKRKEISTATIIDKFYQGAQHHSGTGIGMTTNGSATIVSTSSDSDEEWSVAVKRENGKIQTVNVLPEYFYSVSIGDKCTLIDKYGLIWNQINTTSILEDKD